MALPTLTPEQRAASLAKAAEARRARAQLKDSLAKGELTVADVLSSDDETCLRLPVKQLLRALPGIGVHKADAIMEELGIAEKRRVKGLGSNQKAALIDKVSSL